MKKIALSELFTANNYVAPPFSPEKKAQIFAKTIRKKRSFLSLKKKYFVEIALSLILVFVIGFNLDYIQDIGKPIEINYQEILDLELGVPSSDQTELEIIIDSGASSDSLAVLGDHVEDVKEVNQEIVDKTYVKIDEKIYVETNEETDEEINTVVTELEQIAVEQNLTPKTIPEEIDTMSLWDKIFGKNTDDKEDKEDTEKFAYEIVTEKEKEKEKEKEIVRQEDVIEKVAVEKAVEEKLAYEIIPSLDNVTKQAVEEETAEVEKVEKVEIEKEIVVPKEVVVETQLLDIAADEILPETTKVSYTVVEKSITSGPVEESVPVYMLEEDAELSLSFIGEEKISVFENSAKLNFSIRVDGQTLLQSENLDLVCNIYLDGNFVDSFTYMHRVGYDVKKGDTYSFVDTLGSSYALYVLHSYSANDFKSDASGIKCGIPKYNISARWIDLAYDN